MQDHVVVIGYGTKGRSAVDTLVSNGTAKEAIMVVDPSSAALGDAHEDGLAVVTGDATRREVLRRAGVDHPALVEHGERTVVCDLEAQDARGGDQKQHGGTRHRQPWSRRRSLNGGPRRRCPRRCASTSASRRYRSG